MARNDIWWFNWNNFPLVNGASQSYYLPGGLQVKIEIDELKDADFYASKMNTWSGSILHLLYDFTDPTVKPALFSEMSTTNPSFKLTFSVTRDGLKIPYTIIAADAEASDNHEFTTFITSGTNWETIQFFRNSSQTNNPVQGCGTNTVTLSETYGGSAQSGQNPVLATSSDGQQPLTINTSLKRVGVYGGMAVAFGILAPLDYGDLNSSYGFAYHQLKYEIKNACNISSPLPAIEISKTLLLGQVPGDSDQEGFSNDNQTGEDEDAIKDFPEYPNAGFYELNVPVINTTGSIAYLNAWFDYNRNGMFEPVEMVSKLIPHNTTSSLIKWTGLPTYLPIGTVNGYAFRFRLSTDQASISSPIGYSSSGEVEDYFVSSDSLCSLKVLAGPDLVACQGDPVQLNATGATSYNWIASEDLSNVSISNPIAMLAFTAAFIVEGGNPQACIDRDTVVINISPNPVLNSYTQQVCSGEEISLSVTTESGLNFVWEAHPDISNATEQFPIVSPQINTIYKVTASTASGCKTDASVNLEIKPNPGIDLISDTIICAATLVEISNRGESVLTYRWFSSSEQFASTTSSISLTPVNPIILYLEGTGLNGCKGRDSIAINFHPKAPIVVSSDTTTCSGIPVTLVSSGAVSYNWFNSSGILLSNSNFFSVNPLVNTSFLLNALDENGCDYFDTVLVSIRIPSIMSANSSDSIACLNESITLSATGGLTYNWSIQNNPSFSDKETIEVRPYQSTIYTVEVMDQICNSIQVFEVPVEIRQTPELTIMQSNPISCKTPEAFLRVSGAHSYEWNTSISNQPINSNSIKIRPVGSTTYTVTGYDDIGCSATDSIEVLVDFSDKNGNPSIPTAFSPNQDGKNDCFSVKNWPASEKFSIEIFNRFGQLVFSDTKIGACWDGKLHGNLQPEGTYVFQIKSEGSCGSIYKKGLVLLLR